MESGPIIVIGGGLAGLVAARRLQRAGRDVVVLEAADFVGGRTRTSSEGWAEGQYANLGGELIDDSYHAFRAVAQELGVALTDPVAYASAEPGDVSVIEGYLRAGRFVHDGVMVEPQEALRTIDRLRRAIAEHEPVRHEVVEQWIQRAGLEGFAAAAVRSVSRMLTQHDTWECDVHYLFGSPSAGFRRVLGGTQKLADALAEGLDIRLGQKVVRVLRHRKVVVETDDGSTFEGSRVIVATGPFALPGIGFDPPLPEEKLSTVLSLLPATGGKVLVQYAEGEEVRAAFNRVVYSDGPISAAWTCEPQRSTGPAVVAGFVSGIHRHLLTQDDHVVRLLDDLVATGIGRPVTRLHHEIKNWWADPLTMSVTVNPAEEARPVIAAVMSGVEQRTHVSGDYTDASMCGTLEGAVRSGIRAASEVLRTPVRFHTDDVEERLAQR
jgi:monoamine oxidase